MTGPGSVLSAALVCCIFLIGSTAAGFPGEDCFVNDFACDIHVNNTLAIVPDVASLEECRLLCQDTANCSYITHYGNDSFPIDNSCVLHSLCPDIHVCPDCTSEDARCWKFCSGPLEGHVGDNLVSYRPDVDQEVDCLNMCKADDRCAFYTYHRGTDVDLPGVCFLLSSLQEPFKSCSSCSSGPVDCAESSKHCYFIQEDGTLSENVIINSTSTTFTVIPIALGDCGDIAVLAVGGGGRGYNGISCDGGGGSGYVEFSTMSSSETTGNRLLEVTVGAEKEESVVRLGGRVIMEANPGETVAGGGLVGGAGYCGGGAGSGSSSYAGAAGGSGGGDGSTNPHSGAAGGKGSGVDVTTIPVAGFKLSPASPGDGTSDGLGGGAGGIMVDGWGPPAASQYNGEGYGAGSFYANGAANKGVVLISFE